MGFIKKENVSKFWWWNRFVSWIYHLFQDNKFNPRDVNHLSECRYCEDKFNKWEVKDK